MSTQTIEITASSAAGREAVWEVLADGAGYARWGPWDDTRLEREGTPAPDGVGAIRRMRQGRYVIREEVTAFEPPYRLGYRMLSGLPLRDYEAEVTLVEDDRGWTHITWRSRFAPAVPFMGALLRHRLEAVIADVAGRAAEYAAETGVPRLHA